MNLAGFCQPLISCGCRAAGERVDVYHQVLPYSDDTVDPYLASLNLNNNSDDYYDDEYGEDDDPLVPEQPPQLYIPDWNAFNAGANVAAAAANAVKGALGNHCCGGGGGGNVIPIPFSQPMMPPPPPNPPPPPPPPVPNIIIPPCPPMPPILPCGEGKKEDRDKGNNRILPAAPPAPPPPPPIILPPQQPPPPPAPTILPLPMPFPPHYPFQPPPPPAQPPPPPPILPLPPPPVVPPPVIVIPPPVMPPPPPAPPPPLPPPPPPPRCHTCRPPLLFPPPLPPRPPPRLKPPPPPPPPIPACEPAPLPCLPYPPHPTMAWSAGGGCVRPPIRPAGNTCPATNPRHPLTHPPMLRPPLPCPMHEPMIMHPPILPPPPPPPPPMLLPPPGHGFIHLPPPPVPPPTFDKVDKLKPIEETKNEVVKSESKSSSCRCCHHHIAAPLPPVDPVLNPGRYGCHARAPLPPPDNHPEEALRDQCSRECGKSRRADGTLSPCPRHPHNGPGFWTAAGHFIPQPPCDPGARAAGGDMLCRRPELPPRNVCDGRTDHWPPHVCSYHLRHREYYGNRSQARCCPLECFLNYKDPGSPCCRFYPTCAHYKSELPSQIPACRPAASSSTTSCRDDCNRNAKFRTPPVLVYRCDSHGPSFWNKLCRWVFGAPSHHSLYEVDPCESRGAGCFAPGPFIDPSTDPKRRYQHLKRYAHKMAHKWRTNGQARTSRKCPDQPAGITIAADEYCPAEITITSPDYGAKDCCSQGDSRNNFNGFECEM